MAKEVIKDLYRDKPKHQRQRVKLILPVPPSVNSMYFTTRGGAQVLTAKAKSWFATAQNISRGEAFLQKWKPDRKHVWYYMDLDYYFSDRRVRDAHNTLKILCDALEGIFYSNDYHLMPRINFVGYDKQKPRVEIIIKPMTYKGDINEIKNNRSILKCRSRVKSK